MFRRPLFRAVSAGPRRRARLAVEPLDDRCVPATLVVNGTTDNTTSDGTLTLREAILLVNNGGDANAALGRGLTAGEVTQISGPFGDNDTITFAGPPVGQTISLTSGSLGVTQSVTITGPAQGVTISAGQLSRVFDLGDGVNSITVNLTDLTIADGKADGGGSGSGCGAGIRNNANSSLTLTGCMIRDNTAVSYADDGGGVYNAGTLTATNCTFFDDYAFEGGGLLNTTTATVVGCTFVGNTGYNPFNGYAGGAMRTFSSGSTAVFNTLMGGNGGHDIGDQFGIRYTTGDYDLTGDNTGPGSHSIAANPLLGPLGDHGGPTQTFALQPGSPAIAAGTPVGGVTTDQRGLLRDPAQPSIGAFEYNPESLVVTSTADSAAAGGVTLREAVAYAQFLGGSPTVTFAPALAGQTITLTGGPLNLDSDVTIAAPAGGLTVSGNDASQVFVIGDNGSHTPTVALSGLTIAHGSGAQGGAILVLTNSTVDVRDCLLIDNGASDGGAGLYNFNGFATVTDCTFARDNAFDGGGIKNFYGQTTVNHSTFANDFAADGGGAIDNLGGSTQVNNSIFANNTGSASTHNFYYQGGTLAGDFNLTDDSESGPTFGPNTLVNVNPLLAPLGNYGGPTQTFALLPGSPALNAGDPLEAGVDQRGRAVAGGRKDIGAFESQGFNFVTTGAGQSTDAGKAFAYPLTVTVSAVDPGVPVAGGVVTFTAPGSGASAGLGSSSATIDASGVASTTVTANGTAGAYAVTASLGNNLKTGFGLINLAPNTAPTLSNVPSSLTTAPGSSVAFTATATDPDLVNGHPNTLTFSLVGGPAGASIDPDTGAFSWTPGDTTLPGNYTFKVRVSDDGSPSLSDMKTITIGVKPAALVNGDLLVGGTAGNDTIAVNPSKDGKSLVVTINKAVVGTFPAAGVTGKIVVHGLSGNDALSVSSKVTKAAWLFGDAGDDKLTGGGGNNLLVGGDGNDTLSAKAGTNVLIGGAGADKLTGGAGADLLIAGPTAFDADPAGLANIFTEWTSTDSYATKVAALTAGVSGTALTAATVADDGVKDVVSGGKGIDWLIVSPSDAVSKPDPGETVTKV